MKKILLSVLTISLVGAVAIGATGAYFSDTETSTGNTFTAGTIDLMVNSENPWTTSGVIGGDVKPGEGATDWVITLNNVGTNPMDVWKHVTAVGSGGPTPYPCASPIAGNVSSEPECEAEKVLTVRKDDIDTQIDYSLDVDGTDIIGGTKPYVKLNVISSCKIYLGVILAGGMMIVTQDYGLPSGVGDEYQGDVATIAVEFVAQQTTGSMLVPSPECTGYEKKP